MPVPLRSMSKSSVARPAVDYNKEDKNLPDNQQRITVEELKAMNDMWANSIPHRSIERGKDGKTIWKDAKTGDILSHFSAESPEGRAEILNAINAKTKEQNAK